MKFFSGITTLEDLRKAYKKIAIKLHPDNNGGKDADFKAMQNEYDLLYQRLFHTKGKKEDKKTYSKEDIKREADAFKDIIEKLMPYDITIDIVGAWLWVYGNTYQCKDILKTLGFSWASGKKKWYLANEGWTPSKRHMKYEDIKALHGCETVKEHSKKSTKKYSTPKTCIA